MEIDASIPLLHPWQPLTYSPSMSIRPQPSQSRPPGGCEQLTVPQWPRTARWLRAPATHTHGLEILNNDPYHLANHKLSYRQFLFYVFSSRVHLSIYLSYRGVSYERLLCDQHSRHSNRRHSVHSDRVIRGSPSVSHTSAPPSPPACYSQTSVDVHCPFLHVISLFLISPKYLFITRDRSCCLSVLPASFSPVGSGVCLVRIVVVGWAAKSLGLGQV